MQEQNQAGKNADVSNSRSLPMTLEEAYGSVPALRRPEDFKSIQQIAREEREVQWFHKFGR